MPTFFFNLRADNGYLRDEYGDECPTLQDAANRAVEAAAKLLHDPETPPTLSTAVMEITDEYR